MPLTIDTESTGLLQLKQLNNLSIQPHICQLGLELTDDNEKVLAEINVLIKPSGWKIPEEARDVHGISTEMCESHGIPIERALEILDSYVSMNVLIVAHNKAYDTNLVDIEYKRLGKTSPLNGKKQFCTMEAATPLLQIPNFRGGYKWPKLQETYKFCFGKNFEGAHDAFADVVACREIFFYLKKNKMIKV